MPLPNDWPAVLRYAARIRYLHIPIISVPRNPPTQFQYLPVGVWQMLGLSKPEKPTYLFRNLLRVELSERDASFPHCRILIGPTITQLVLFVFGGAQRVGFLISLKESCPLLTSLSILTQKRALNSVQKMAITRGISNAILQRNNLQCLEIGSLTSDAFAHIGDMTSLTELYLYERSSLDQLLVRPQKTFPSLCAFRCVAADLHWVGSLFQTMDSPLLQNINIYSSGRYSSSLWVRACTTLYTSSINLKALHIEERDAPLVDDDSYSVGRDLLSLPIFQKLTFIFLNPWGGFDIDNQTLQNLSADWPQLQSLVLGIKGPWIKPSRITLEGLIPLLLQCPYLRVLGIVINATGPDHSLEMRPGQGIHNSKITILDVGSSQIRNPVNVAAFLSGILPCVTKINMWVHPRNPGLEDIARRDAWNQVTTNLGVFGSVRNWEAISI